ncbi:MAG: putative C-S lyase [Rhodanobacter sp.]|nr:MAG: putative C-S lyase [Rhodanobacter sp.]TAM11066.1 MAG: putative C-S lyase [Rhodanobacter sp.]TAM35535.1 MAG: putative C-S lyase [Rhodanobacter sp.]
MSFDFDQPVDRAGTHALKYDLRAQKFGRADVAPLWIADMDFAAPECVTQALIPRAQHPIYGYTTWPAGMLDALVGWCARRHHWQVETDWLLPANGVLAALSAALQACTQAGDGVIVQPPVYGGFVEAALACRRQPVDNQLHEEAGHYTMDFAQLEQCARAGARTLMLCNPHNPVGRAWSRDELTELLRIARQYGITVISDEVHGDLALPGHVHQPLAALATAQDRVITLLSPSKTFNLQGLGLAVLATANPELRAAVAHQLEALHLVGANPFAVAAAEAAWRGGDAWVDALQTYLGATRDLLIARLPASNAIHAVPPQASYLAWLDCRALRKTDAELRDFFITHCGLGLNPGADYGQGGSGFMRFNFGAPRKMVETALDRIAAALKSA